jgi:hypothetical protein
MFLILWNVLGGILLISSLFLSFSLMRERKPEQVNFPFDSSELSHEERSYS